MIKTLYLCLFVLFSANASEIEDQKINYLLDEIGKSGLTFIRNGSSHSAKEAKSHLKFKFNKAKGLFFWKTEVTAREFIDKIAAKSSTTGETYHIVLKSGKKVPTKQWLDEKLKSFAPPKSP
jgi:hypothetical protein